MPLQELKILHFNDVYHLSDTDLVARFAHIINPNSSLPGKSGHLTVFSGDAFSPSLEAAVLKGEHMVPVLNQLNIDVACYGNHDFDFGEQRLVELSEQTNFPWVLSNALQKQCKHRDDRDPRLLACAQKYVIKCIQGYKIGFFGLAGSDWPSNCQHLPPSTIVAPAEAAKSTAEHLRSIEQCDFVIAITHMRLEEDLTVSNATASSPGKVDLILGGHDHEVVCRFRGDTNSNPMIMRQGCSNQSLVHRGRLTYVEGDIRIVKSGSDWKGLSAVSLIVDRRSDGTAYLSKTQLSQYSDLKHLPNYEELVSSRTIPSTLASVHTRIQAAVKQPLCHTLVSLEGRSSVVRSQETNLGIMLSDALRAFYKTDVGFVNSGSIRCDRILEPTTSESGALRVKDIIDICPFDNAFVVKRVTGSALMAALENSISDLHMDGRFLQCSGLRFVGNWKKRQGERVTEAYWVTDDGSEEKLRMDRSYTAAMTAFIAAGFDGYTCFKGAANIIDEEGAMTDTNLLLQIFGYKSLEEDTAGTSKVDETSEGIERARKAIIIGVNPRDQLPTISPVKLGRIKLYENAVM